MEPKNMVAIICIIPLVKKFQYCHLHHALVKVRRSILDHFDSHNRVRFQILALDNLPKSSLSKNIQDEISIRETT
jgi:hypothetical protein